MADGRTDERKRKRTSQDVHSDKNKKFRSFKSKENIYKKDVGPYHGFGY